MLDSYRPNVGLTLVRHPQYFGAGLPYIDRAELLVDEDDTSRTAAFLAGKYDLGWEFPGTINRSDWVQIAEPLKKRRPGLQVAEFPSNVVNDISLRADKPPYSDVRVRQAICLAMDRKAQIDSIFEGVGAVNGPLPAALDDWALPIAQLGEGARYYRHDPAEAKRLGRAAQPESRQRPRARRPARAPAPHGRPQAAARHHPPDPAPPGASAVLHPRAVGDVRRGLGPGAARRWAESGLRLRGTDDGGVAGAVRGRLALLRSRPLFHSPLLRRS
jgi:Bacterial extracellular solute-binding proteins, family 5 Middle